MLDRNAVCKINSCKTLLMYVDETKSGFCLACNQAKRLGSTYTGKFSKLDKVYCDQCSDQIAYYKMDSDPGYNLCKECYAAAVLGQNSKIVEEHTNE